MRNPPCRTLPPILILVGLLAAPPAPAEAPPRAASGQTLVVPATHLDDCDVYYVMPGEDAQLVITSDSPLQRTVLTCRRVVGYVSVPLDVEKAPAPLVGGALRIPVASLESGTPGGDAQVRELLGAEQHAEITFELTGSKDARRIELKDAGDQQEFELTATGRLVFRDRTVELTVPLRMRLIPFTWTSMMGRYPGELLNVRAEFDVSLAQLGFEKPRPLAARLADTLHVELFLLANTVPPDKSLNPRLSNELNHKLLAYLTQARDFGRVEQACSLGQEVLEAMWADAALLDEFVRLAADAAPDRRDLGLALRAARRAAELQEQPDATRLTTVARLYAQQGDFTQAAAWQTRAVAAAEAAAPPADGGDASAGRAAGGPASGLDAAALRADLVRYEARASCAESDSSGGS